MMFELHSRALRWSVVISVLIATTPALAENEIPAKLKGRWTSLDGSAGQAISANIDPATAKGTLTVWANKANCTVSEAPLVAAREGDKLILTVDASYVNPCRSNISVELTKKPDSDSWEGELHQKGDYFQVLVVKMRP